MCTTSVIGDQFQRSLPGTYPNHMGWVVSPPTNGPTRQEFDDLKRDMQELKELLRAAKKYDEATGQIDCEQEDKIALLKKLAQLVGVDLSDVFPEAE